MRIGLLIPGTIALALLIDAGTRLIPIDLFAFRAWEALVVRRGPTGPFEPGRVYVNPLTYGDLARPQRYTASRQRHLEYFSTDAWGYRNTVGPPGAVKWLLIGDSFGVSSGVSDGGTLASQLARWSGERVYNAAADAPLPLNDIRFTRDRVGMTDGLVIYEYMERQDLPQVGKVANARTFTNGPPPARTVAERFRALQSEAAISRMSIVAGWGWDAIATKLDLVRFNTSTTEAGDLPTARFELADGATMLFLARDVEVTLKPDRQIAAPYLIWLKTELEKLNLELAVLITPTKYHVYASSIKDSTAPPSSDVPLQRLTETLSAHGVFAVNVTAALQEQATRDLGQHQYVYFLDDTHWNERGIGVAARAFANARRRAQASASP